MYIMYIYTCIYSAVGKILIETYLFNPEGFQRIHSQAEDVQ